MIFGIFFLKLGKWSKLSIFFPKFLCFDPTTTLVDPPWPVMFNLLASGYLLWGSPLQGWNGIRGYVGGFNDGRAVEINWCLLFIGFLFNIHLELHVKLKNFATVHLLVNQRRCIEDAYCAVFGPSEILSETRCPGSVLPWRRRCGFGFRVAGNQGRTLSKTSE